MADEKKVNPFKNAKPATIQSLTDKLVIVKERLEDATLRQQNLSVKAQQLERRIEKMTKERNSQPKERNSQPATKK